MVLGKGGGNVIGTLIGVAIFGVVACVGFGAMLGEGSELNPVMIVIFIIIGLVVLSSLANAISGTRVVLDTNQRTATRTSSFFLIPTGRQEMAFNLIRDVRVAQARGGGVSAAQLALSAFPVWQVQLRATDGSTLVVNENGTRAEMDALAQNVGILLGRPVRADEATSKAAAPASPPATGYTPAGVMGSLYENLVQFAQSATESASQSSVPTVSAFPDTSPRMEQEEMERTPRGQRRRRRATAPPPPNTFSTSTTIVNPDESFIEGSRNLVSQQTAAEGYDALSLSPVAFSAPPVLAMPEMPALFSFSPALDMPAFPPLGGAMLEPTASPDMAEMKQVEIEVSPYTPSRASGSAAPPPPTAPDQSADASAQFNAARQLLAAHKYRDAEAALARVLNMNPADAAVQNDLGVVYLEENKLPDAERAFRRAIALDPALNVSRYNLGIALYRMQRRSEANEQFKAGALYAARNEETYFRDGQRGILRAPMLS